MRRLEGGRAHFHLYSSQFVSKSQTVWDGDLPKCNKAAIFLFDHRIIKTRDFAFPFSSILKKMAVLGPLQKPLSASLFVKTQNFSFFVDKILQKCRMTILKLQKDSSDSGEH